MYHSASILIFTILMQTTVIFDFTKDSKSTNWSIVDDVVMGGKSSGSFYVSDEGFGIFSGKVSLGNNGGFSSLRYRFAKVGTASYSKIVLRVKGDKKRYQFRVKNSMSDSYSFISYFNTTGSWQTVEIPLNTLYPVYRGRKLDKSNFNKSDIEEIGFLIGNKKAETFKLEIDKIFLK